jgi:hypothetical protein
MVYGSSSSDESVWELPKSRRSRGPVAALHHRELAPVISVRDDSVVDRLIDDVERICASLENILDRERFWDRYTFPPIATARAYGIGSLENSRISIYQFSFILILSNKFEIPKNYYFDPVSTANDLAVVESFGFITAGIDDQASIGVVLMYMPHCDRNLYLEKFEKFKNYLEHFIFISNFFSFYSFDLTFEESPLFVYSRDADRKNQRIAKRSSEIPFEAFNDLAIVRLID